MQNCITREVFNVVIHSANSYDTTNPHITSRLNNAMVKGFNSAHNLPKFVVVVLENDIINEVEKRKYCRQRQEYYGKLLESTINDFQKMVNRMKLLLPSNAKREGWPKLLFITPTLHRNYADYEAKI